jgi:hypothetical protein
VLAPFEQRGARFEARLATAPVRVAVDPEFDTFRRLLPEESPASLSSLFGAGEGLLVLPDAAPAAVQNAYQRLAQAWQQGHEDWRITSDAALDSLPDSGAVWIFGWENAFADEVAAAAGDLALDTDARGLVLADKTWQGVSVALAAGDAARPLGWVAAAEPAAVPGLARKLPHYGKYGYLTFTGDAPDNQLKGQWPPGDSTLVRWLADTRPKLGAPARTTLVRK